METVNAGTIFRGDLMTSVEQAMGADQMFIAEKVMPMFGVPVRNGQYLFSKIGHAGLLTPYSSPRLPGTSYPNIHRTLDRDTYDCQDWGAQDFVDDSEKRYLDRYISLEQASAKWCMRSVRLGYEQRVAAAIMNASTFTATNASVSYIEANLATANPVKDIQDAITRLKALGCYPNTIVLSINVSNYIKRTTLFQNFVKPYGVGTAGAIPNNDTVVAAFRAEGITTYLESALNYNTADDGSTVSLTPVWGNTYIFVGYVADGDPRNGGAGRTFVWTQDVGGLYVAESWYNNELRGQFIRCRMNEVEKVIDSTCGQLVATGYTGS